MYNSYVGSTLSLRCKGSFSFSLNDYSYLLDDRFDGNPKPLSSQSCCACCFNSMHIEPIVNPSFLYGLRQFALIQCSASRKLILGGGDLYYRRFPAYDVCQTCCEFVKERSVSGSRRLGEGRFWPKVAVGKSVRHRERDIDDVEVLLSLLTEEVSEECFGVKERNLRSLRRKEEEKRGSGTAYRNKKENDTSATKESREVDYRRKEDKESHLRGETQWIRKNGSSCSSYYSCGSMGEFESDDDVQVRQEGYRGESSSDEFKRSSKESGELTCDGETVEEVKSRGGVTKEHGIVIQQGKTALGSYKTSSGVECDWRKKSEKKLTEESIGQTESLNKSLNMHTRQKFVGREETPTLDVTYGDETRQQYSKKDEQINGQFESSTKYKHFTRNQEIHDSEQNLRAVESLVLEKRNEQTKTASRVSQKNEYERHSQKLDKVSKIQEMNDISQVQSEAIVKRREDKSSEILSSVNNTERNYHITGQRDSIHMDSRRKIHEVTEISDTHGIHIDNTSASPRQSDTRMENQHFVTSQQAFRKTESRKGSQDKSNISVVHSTDASRRDSKKRISSQETYSASVVQSTKEVFQIGSRTDTQRPTKVLGFSEGTTMEASASQAALVLRTQPIEQHIGMDVGVEISSEVVIPLPSQLVERGPLHAEPTSDFQIQQVSSASLGSASVGGASRDETHEDPLNFIYQEDALGSADRLQKSSMQFVGEFVEKVTHEVATSKIQTELVNKSHNRQEKSSNQYGSEDFKPKEHESRRSSRSSGVKGPSDEIWDVTGPPIQESSVTEAPESTTPTTNNITKRNGRSLWNIISDIVRLRWASSSHNSPQRSVGRSSPNQSVNSEAWFSGHELDEKGNENVKGGKESTAQGSTSSKQHNLVSIPMENQGQGSTSACSKDKKGSSIASKEISLGPTEVNVGRGGTEVVESSLSMTSLQLSRLPHIDRISEAGKTDVSASGSLVQEQASDTGLIGKSGTEGRDGELKRRKFQRSSQVPNDRFDEWEEAYKIESEQRRMDEVFMREALLEAKKGADIWEVPVGAVLVQHGKIIARGYNVVEELRDCTAHAEMICIREASNLLRTWRLSETTLYITLEPCPMCAGAILQARIDSVVWGAPNKLLGADGSWISLFPVGAESGNPSESAGKPPAPIHPFHPKIVVRREVLATECADAMQQFFQRRRKKEKKAESSCFKSSFKTLNEDA